MKQRLLNILHSTPVGLCINLLWVYVAYAVCRVVFVMANLDTYAHALSVESVWHWIQGGWRFDSSAIFYTNSLLILLYLLPLHFKERQGYYRLLRWWYVVVNTLAVTINMVDTVFFAYRMQRSTMATLREFGSENNLLSIVGHEVLSHWYMAVLVGVMVWAFWRGFRVPATPAKPLWRYYLINSLTLVIAGVTAVCGMRGNVWFLSATRPISVGYAQRFCTDPVETAIVLNTPFALIRTVGQVGTPTPVFFSDQQELDEAFNPVFMPCDSVAGHPGKNIVILIVESLAGEFCGFYNHNRDLDGGTYRGYTPFVDSLAAVSLTWEQTFCNTYFSIDAPPAVLAGIPRVERPFTVSPHSLNHINSIASELKPLGYTSAFFHGADNESLGFAAFMKQAGVDRYYGLDEYCSSGLTGGRSDHDGTWGVWDEPFLQYFANELTRLPQPWMASVFTLSSHHPFAVPEHLRDSFPEEGMYPLLKCVRYADWSLRRFFETASRQPWYNNTIFVICADHASSKRIHPEYRNNAVADFRVPLLLFDPSGEMPRGMRPGVAQQTDIMPTLLRYIGVRRPFVAWGQDLLAADDHDMMWAFNWDHLPQLLQGRYLLQYRDSEISGFYDYVSDPGLTNDLTNQNLPQMHRMEHMIRGIMQSYLQRMNTDTATAHKR